MRTPVLICCSAALTAAAIAAAVAVGNTHHTAPQAPRTPAAANVESARRSEIPAPAASTAPSASTPVPTSSSMPTSPSELPNLTLSPAGSEIWAGTSATVTVTDSDGRTVYVRAVVDELTQQPSSAAYQLLSRLSALDGYSRVYEMPIKLTVLGVLGVDGSPSPTARLTPAALDGFSVAMHPGSTPLLNQDALNTPGCSGLPTPAVTLRPGSELAWCVHAFARPQDDTPIGGQYQAQTGPFTAALVWASKTFHGSPRIP